jgi:phosphohistidine phosphatase
MKKLFLVRHSKSAKDNPILPDYDRPLNSRGYKDAREFGAKLKKIITKPDVFVTSPSIRTLSTAIIFADVFNIDPKTIVLEKLLYESTAGGYLNVIQMLDNSFSSVMLFGHNHTLTELANSLTKPFTDNIPTSGVTGIEFSIKNWKDIEGIQGKLFLYDFPKNSVHNQKI